MDKIKSYIKLMRPHHYIKNILIFLPLIFSKNIFNLQLLKITIIGAISFSLITSVVYIINDILDLEEDRKHEIKKNRPIASGKVTIKGACTLGMILILINAIFNMYIINQKFSNFYWLSCVIVYGYLFINILYSIKLKHVPILDITILAIGFLIRVIYGALITGIEVSNWLYLTILAFSFYMGLGKRRNELKNNGSKSRIVLERYNQNFLNNNMYVCMTMGIVFYSLWCMDISNTINSFFNIIYTIPLVIIICMKYNLNIENNSSGDPVDIILVDKILLALILIYIIIIFTIIYF